MAEDRVICPLLTTNTVVQNDRVSIGTQPVFCIKEQCAWWVEGKQKCAIAIITGGKK